MELPLSLLKGFCYKTEQMVKSGGAILGGSLVVAATVCSFAGEPVSVAGIVEAAPVGQFFSSHFLRHPESGEIVAGLSDSENRLSTGGRRVTLQTERLEIPEINGLPILRVVSVLPDHWAQPSVWSGEQKGPGTFSGFQMDREAKDFAGMPFTSSRAYSGDHGLEGNFHVPRTLQVGTSLRVVDFRTENEGFVVSFEAVAGLSYELQFTETVEEEAETVATVRPLFRGLATISVPRESEGTGFYLIRAVSL